MHTRQMLPADRFYARLDRFQCECPSCGRVISTQFDEIRGPERHRSLSERRKAAKEAPKNKSVRDLTWNPHTQGLKCPWCGRRYVAGLLLYPHRQGARLVRQAPPDTIPTRRQDLETRTHAQGWWLKQGYAAGEPVNVVADAPCLCPDHGWAPACPIHGEVLRGIL